MRPFGRTTDGRPLVGLAVAVALLVVVATTAVASPILPTASPRPIEPLEAILLGLVEGVTEYLPVSSTGHLILTERALGIPASIEANAFLICIQAGAIAAVLLLYRRRVGAMLRGLAGRDAVGRRLAVAVAAAFVPAAVVGLLLEAWIEEALFGLWPVTAAWFVGGAAIVVVVRARRGRARRGLPLEAITARMALVIGLAQCLALWPGTSRSLVTIVAGLLVGLEIVAAVEFSFLLGLVTLGAATVYKAWDAGPAMWDAYGPGTLALGFLAAAASAALAVRWLVRWLQRRGLEHFGWYRIALAIVVSALILSGALASHAAAP